MSENKTPDESVMDRIEHADTIVRGKVGIPADDGDLGRNVEPAFTDRRVPIEVKTIELRDENESRVALAQVQIGSVLISGVSVWQGRNGRLRVFFPGYKQYGGPGGYSDAIDLSADMRSEVEAIVLTKAREKLREHKKQARLREKREKRNFEEENTDENDIANAQ